MNTTSAYDCLDEVIQAAHVAGIHTTFLHRLDVLVDQYLTGSPAPVRAQEPDCRERPVLFRKSQSFSNTESASMMSSISSSSRNSISSRLPSG